MTELQYERAYLAAIRNAGKITRDLAKQLKTVYEEAARKAAEQVLNAELSGYADITVQSWRNIELALEEGARNITAYLDDLTKDGVLKSGENITAIDEKYLIDIINKNNIGISTIEINNLFVAVNDSLITNMLSRIYADGYTFSQRIWKVGIDYQNQIKQLITSDLAVGRDLVETARDLEVYIQEGRRGIAKRWGDLVKGNRDWLRRIGKDIDYNALRLIRSELYASLKSTAVLSGQMNPGCTGLYDWIRQTTENWDCDCPDYEKGSPYTAQDVPSQPHPNCFPAGTKIKTLYGDKNIEEIIPGDYIITHKGNAKQVLLSWKSLYKSDIIIIKTEKGNIEATSNHPFLSNGRWIPAHLLKNGDNLSSISIDIKPLSFIKSESNDGPSDRFKIFSFFSIMLFFNRAGMPIPTINFDGQFYILKSEINIKCKYSKIRERFLSKFYNGFIQHSFIRGPDLSGPELSAFNFLFIRVDSASSSLISRAGISDLTVFISTIKRFTLSKRFETMSQEIPINTTPRDSKSICYLFDREILFAKKLNNNLPIKINSCTHNISIVSVSKKKVNTYVYNLTVKDDHSYYANGVAVHNCLCYVVPRLRDRQQFVDDLKAWTNGESVDYLDEWNANYFQFVHEY
jgi:hypothetical protein